jgi:hypothetical protein
MVPRTTARTHREMCEVSAVRGASVHASCAVGSGDMRRRAASECVKSVPRSPSVNDRSDAAADVRIRLARASPPDRKVGLVEDANRMARRLELAGIHLLFPEVRRMSAPAS